MMERFEFKKDPENDMFIGPAGCHYSSIAEAMYCDVIGLCGCGSPSEVHQFLLDCMKAECDEYKNILDRKKVADLVKAQPEVVAEFVLHFLDSKQLTEHGSSVNASWLTPLGKQVIEVGVSVDD